MNQLKNISVKCLKCKESKCPLWAIDNCFFVCSLRPIDIQFMKQLNHKVNIVPVIAKADTLTKMEMRRLKERVSSIISSKNPCNKRP